MVDWLDLTALSMVTCLRVFSVKCQGKLRDGTVAMTWMWHGRPGAAGQGWHMIAIGSLCRRAPLASSASVESYNSPLQLYIELPSIHVQPANPKAAVCKSTQGKGLYHINSQSIITS